MTGPARPPPLRRNARFQFLWIGSLASMLGSKMSALAYPLLTLAITDSPAKAGLVSAAQLSGIVVMSVPAGPWVDRWDRRRVLIGCEVVRAAGVGSVAFAVLADRVVLPHLLLVGLTQGGATALFNPARLAAVRAVVPESQLQSALAQEEARTYAAALAGPPLGGVLFSVGRAIPFLADLVSYLVSLVCVAAARVSRRPETVRRTNAGAEGMTAQFREGLRWLWDSHFVRAVSGFSLAVNFAIGGMLVPVIVLVENRGGSPAMTGGVMAAMGAGGLLGAALAARIGRLLPPGHLVLAGSWSLAILFPAVALPYGTFWPGVVLALIMFIPPTLTVTIQATVLSETPDDMQGRVGALSMMASLAVAPLGPLVTGFLTQAVGPAATLFLVGGFLAVVSGIAALAPALRHSSVLVRSS